MGKILKRRLKKCDKNYKTKYGGKGYQCGIIYRKYIISSDVEA